LNPGRKENHENLHELEKLKGLYFVNADSIFHLLLRYKKAAPLNTKYLVGSTFWTQKKLDKL